MQPHIYPLIILLLALTGAVGAQPSDVFHEDIQFARNIYLEATNGNKRNVRKAIQHMTGLEAKYPNHPLVRAFKGGALALRGLDVAERPLNRLRDTEEGLGVIDRALRQLTQFDGDYIDIAETQLVAAYVFVNIPDTMFHRLQEGSGLVKQLLAHPRFADMPKTLQAAIYFAAATAADKSQQQEESKRYLTLTAATDPDGSNGKTARDKLDALAGKQE